MLSSSENKLLSVPDDSAPLVLLLPLVAEAPLVDAPLVDALAADAVVPEVLNRLVEPVWFDDVNFCSSDSRSSALDAPAVIAGNMIGTP